MEMYKVPKPDAEGALELLQQIRTELERQRREQRNAIQQLITEIRDLLEKIAWRSPPFKPAAKKQCPLSVEVCCNEEQESEMHATAVFLADSEEALRLLVGVHSGATAPPRNSVRLAWRSAATRSRSPRCMPQPCS